MRFVVEVAEDHHGAVLAVSIDVLVRHAADGDSLGGPPI